MCLHNMYICLSTDHSTRWQDKHIDGLLITQINPPWPQKSIITKYVRSIFIMVQGKMKLNVFILQMEKFMSRHSLLTINKCTLKPASAVTSIKLSLVFKGHLFLSRRRKFHMNWTSVKGSPVLYGHFFFASKVTS